MNVRSESASPEQRLASERIGLVCRQDIKWTRSVEKGETRFVASDPFKVDHFSCSEVDYQILQWVAPEKTYQQLCDQFHDHFRPATLEPSELRRLLGKCLQSGVLRAEFGNRQSYTREESVSSIHPKSRLLRFASSVVNLVQYQLSFGSLGWLLNALTKPLSVLFAPALVPFVTLLFVVAGVSITYRWEEFWANLPTWNELRSPSALIGYGLIFFVTRAIHELGHASACKRFGLECRDVGLLVSFGMICPYVDISEGWKAKNRLHRLVTAFGGIYFELTIASLAAIVWSFTTASLTNSICYQTLLVCSLTTMLFNANPLMKYDGYFMLSDALGVNNLRDKSWQAFDRLVGGRLDSSLGKQLGLCLYHLGSLLNRAILLGTLGWFVYRVAVDWQVTGLAIACLFLYVVCMLVIWIASWTKQSKESGRRIPLRAQMIGWLGTVCVAVWAMSLPLPKRSWGIGKVKPGEVVSVYTNELGIIEAPLRADGDEIAFDDTIAVLRNPDLLREKFKLQSEFEQAAVTLKSMDNAAYHNSRVLDQKRIAESRFQAIKIQVEEIDRRIESLTIKATQSGHLRFVPPAKENEEGLLRQASYQTSRQQTRITSLPAGILLPKDSLIGEIITSDDPHIECEIKKEQMDIVGLGTPVAIRLSMYPNKVLKGIVSKVSSGIVSEFQSVAITQNTGRANMTEQAIGKVLLRIDCDELKLLGHSAGNAELMFHHFDQSMWDYIVEAVLRNTRWR